MFSIYSTLLACGLGIKPGFHSALPDDETADVKVLPDHKYSLKTNFLLEGNIVQNKMPPRAPLRFELTRHPLEVPPTFSRGALKHNQKVNNRKFIILSISFDEARVFFIREVAHLCSHC